MSRKGAQAYVLAHHRHSGSVAGMKFAIACREKDAELVLGIALVGRPVSRNLDDGWTLEVNRLCTEGHDNVGSFLYAATWRATKALGYRRLVTYTLASESGSSLRGAGWRVIAHRGKKTGWTSAQRPNPAEYLSTQRVLWEAGPEQD